MHRRVITVAALVIAARLLTETTIVVLMENILPVIAQFAAGGVGAKFTGARKYPVMTAIVVVRPPRVCCKGTRCAGLTLARALYGILCWVSVNCPS